MGNYRFRLSDMIPNSWFYKLKEMNKTRNWKNANPSKKKQTPSSVAQPIQPPITTQISHLSDQRKSYYFTRDLNPEPNNLTFYTNSSPSTTRVCEKKIPEPPRKSSRRRRSTKRIRNSSVRPSSSSRLVTDTSISTGCRCVSNVESVWTKPDSTPEEYPDSPNGSSSSENESLLPEYGSDRDTFDDTLSWSTSRIENDIIIDMENRNPFNAKSDATDHKLNGFENLPPIITRQSKTGDTEKVTKPTETTNSTKILRTSAKVEEKNAFGSLSVKVVKEDILSNNPKQHKITTSPVRRLQPGLKLRTNSPRLAASLRIQGRKGAVSTSSSSSRRSVSESFAIVKSSQNPQRDFRESMVEMIVENNIRASKDLEELLACYLSLNSDEYHDLIISVFKQIWFDIIDI